MPPEMSNQEAIQMMQRCLSEIQGLRAENDRLRPKADAYDNLAIALHYANPRQGGIMGEDMVWTLKKRIEELQPKPDPNAV